jgi:hypothetical protein
MKRALLLAAVLAFIAGCEKTIQEVRAPAPAPTAVAQLAM